MKKEFTYFLILFAGIVGTIIFLELYHLSFQPSIKQLCVGGVFVLCFLLVIFITVASLTSEKKYRAALNMPDGSVRAIIALLSIVFFVLLSVVFFFTAPSGDGELPKQILTILGTLVTAICAFYFGAKATEQGSRMAQEAFKAQAEAAAPADVPLAIIQQAIAANRSNWLSQYSCTDIVAGKKMIQGTVQNTNCIVFVVATKTDAAGSASIPASISYNSGGTSYMIPTDVQAAPSASNVVPLPDDGQSDVLMRSAIRDNYVSWKARYPNIIGCTVGLKKTGGALVPVKCLIFKVNGKVGADTLGAGAIPATITYQGTSFPTDIVDTGSISALGIVQPGDNFNPARLGTSVSRDNSSEFGTASLKVKIPRPGDFFDYYLLSCFHVLYPERLDPLLFSNLQQTVTNVISDPSTLVSIPAKSYLSANPASAPVLQGYVRNGIISPMMDAAIAQINDPDLAQTIFDNTLINGEVSSNSLSVGQMLYIYGCVSGKLNGTISDLQCERTDVLLTNGQITFSYTFNELIEVAVPCQQGDSGAPVLTSHGDLVGIITAGNGNSSYVIPFPNIKNTLSVQL
jgi:hypothetical protein